MNKNVNRVRLREILMNCVYQMDIKQEYEISAVNSYLNIVRESEEIDSDNFLYISDNLTRFIDNKEEIDGLIEQSLKKWKLDRISSIDFAIIRTCITEILYDDKIPYKVSINEALNLAKKFSDGDDGESVKFINGLMRNVLDIRGIK